jgi:AcrR family transcriptional regulator
MAAQEKGRPQQRLRTRKDLLLAAARLMKQGHKPGLEEVAAEAMVSRATAYRYFPDIDALLAEASLDVDAPGADSLFPPGAPADPVARLEIVDKALHDLVLARESQMRIMLAQTVVRALEPVAAEAIPARQNRRTPLIEAALAPAREEFSPAALRRLGHALALVIGTEGFIAAKDVLRLDDAETRRVKRWAIRALVEAARKPAHRG